MTSPAAPADPQGDSQGRAHGHGHAHGAETQDAAKQDAATQGAPAKRPRDLRLDFFRGLAMFIILLAHIPSNPWALWIPARFGFSDATEIFVFCSGMASSLAFGGVFAAHGWPMGTARILYRVWQVYWAHIALVLACAAMLYAIDAYGLGEAGRRHIARVPIVPLFEDTGPALVGLFTLTWVPNFFDILPMYLAILAMIPLVMAAHRAGGRTAAAALIGALWLTAQTGLLDLPSRPWAPEIPWFFNPFGWQLVFFCGFALGMGWIRAPRPTPARLWTAAAVLVLSVPFAWFRIHDGLYLPDAWPLQNAVAEARAATEILWRKSEFGLLRWLHFLALAYLAWAAAGEGGRRLAQPLRLPAGPSALAMRLAAVLALATIPWVYVDEIAALFPALDARLTQILGEGAEGLLGTDLFVPGERLGLLALVHVGALLVLAWGLIGAAGRAWVEGPFWAGFVPVVRKVGTQSLAVFLTSMMLAQIGGVVLDHLGRGAWAVGLVNAVGFAILVVTAYLVGWFKSQPWRGPGRSSSARRETTLSAAGGTPGDQAAALRTPAE